MQTESPTLSSKKYSSKNLMESVQEIGPLLSKEIEEEENNRRLSEPVLNALREAGLLKLFLPMSLGGLEVDPLTVAKLVEQVASYNTAAGWCLMVANTSAFWCSRFPEEGIDEIYQNGPDTIMAGAFHPPMKATPVDGGYVINGRSPLTSNVHEAQWIFVTAFVMENEQIKTNNGIPEIIGVAMKSGECEIVDTWYTIGMKATDSNDISVNNVTVPQHRSFALAPEFQPNKYYKGLLYKLPAIAASIASLISPVAIAVANNAIQELKLLADKKVPFASMVSIREKGTVQRKLGIAQANVRSSRAFLHQEISLEVVNFCFQ